MLTTVLQPAAERAGLGRVTWHQFRDIHSSLLNDLNVPAKIAQEQRGAGLSDSDLKAPVTIFGMDSTKQAAAMMLLGGQHEHLGQSIAYARSNGVVPPWSK